MRSSSMAIVIMAAFGMLLVTGCTKKKKEKATTSADAKIKVDKTSKRARPIPKKNDTTGQPSAPGGSGAVGNVAQLVGKNVLLIFATRAHREHHPSCEGKIISVGPIGLFLQRTKLWNMAKKKWINSPGHMFMPWASVRELFIKKK